MFNFNLPDFSPLVQICFQTLTIFFLKNLQLELFYVKHIGQFMNVCDFCVFDLTN